MKGCLKPLARRRVVNSADKAHGPGREVADLKLPNEPKAKEGDDSPRLAVLNARTIGDGID